MANHDVPSERSSTRSPSGIEGGDLSVTWYVLGAVLVASLAAAIFVVVAYSVFSYSVILGTIMVLGSITVAVAVLMFAMTRRAQGAQTELEKQAFEKAVQGKRLIQEAYGEAGTRYRGWSETRNARMQQEAEDIAAERERNRFNASLDEYRAFFKEAYKGSNYFLEWSQAYARDVPEGDGPGIPDLLRSSRQRAEAGLRRVEGLEGRIAEHSYTEEFGERARISLNSLKVGQENFHGSESVFTPLTAVHNRLEEESGWVRFRDELEELIQDLEQRLGSSEIRTAAAGRSRFPDPARRVDDGLVDRSNGKPGASLRCLNCSRMNLPQAKFCSGCGASLAGYADQQQPHAPAGQQRPHSQTPPSLQTNSEATGSIVVSSLVLVLALFSGLIGLFFLPVLLIVPPLGALGIYAGYKARQEGSETGGLTLMILNGSCAGCSFFGFVLLFFLFLVGVAMY